VFRIPGKNVVPNAYIQTPDEMVFGHGSPLSLNYKEARFTTTDTGVLEFKTRGPALTGMWVDWGDGSRQWIQHIGTGSGVTTNHDYDSLAGTKNVVFSGVLTDVTYFLCNDGTFGGNIGVFTQFGSLTHLDLYLTAISGDIIGLAGLSLLSYLVLDATSVSGDVADIATLTSLVVFGANNTSVSGDVAGIATLTSLAILSLNNTSVSGDVADIATLTSLVILGLYNTSVGYTTTTLPTWAGSTAVQDCSWTQAEVDAFLIDIEAAGGSGGTLNIAGNNAVHSAASDAAVTALLARSWTLTLSV
jgi:hypothetical protein